MLAARYAKSYHKREISAIAHLPHKGGQPRRQVGPRSRYAGHAHAVDEPRRQPRHPVDPLPPRRRRQEIDQVDIARPAEPAQPLRLLRRQVDDYQAVPTGSGGSGDKGLRAVCQDRVVVSHKQEGDLKPLRAQLAHYSQAVGGGHPLPESREARPLDGDAVRQGVAEGNAQLHHVGPAAGQGVHERGGGPQAGIAGGQEGHQGGPAFGAGAGKCGGYAAQATLTSLPVIPRS